MRRKKCNICHAATSTSTVPSLTSGQGRCAVAGTDTVCRPCRRGNSPGRTRNRLPEFTTVCSPLGLGFGGKVIEPTGAGHYSRWTVGWYASAGQCRRKLGFFARTFRQVSPKGASPGDPSRYCGGTGPGSRLHAWRFLAISAMAPDSRSADHIRRARRPQTQGTTAVSPVCD